MSQTEVKPSEVQELEHTIEKIGVARFVGRINSGLVEPEIGYKVVNSFVSRESNRPLLSRLSHLLLGRSDTYNSR